MAHVLHGCMFVIVLHKLSEKKMKEKKNTQLLRTSLCLHAYYTKLKQLYSFLLFVLSSSKQTKLWHMFDIEFFFILFLYTECFHLYGKLCTKIIVSNLLPETKFDSWRLSDKKRMKKNTHILLFIKCILIARVIYCFQFRSISYQINSYWQQYSHKPRFPLNDDIFVIKIQNAIFIARLEKIANFTIFIVTNKESIFVRLSIDIYERISYSFFLCCILCLVNYYNSKLNLTEIFFCIFDCICISFIIGGRISNTKWIFKWQQNMPFNRLNRLSFQCSSYS